MQEFSVAGVDIGDLVSIGDEEEVEDDLIDGDEGDEEDEFDLDNDTNFLAYQQKVRVEAAQRAEQARRPGGVRTQKAMERAWEVRVLP